MQKPTISQEQDGTYYASVLYEFVVTEVPRNEHWEQAIGLDYKSDGLYMDSNGTIGSSHKYYREFQKTLAKEQRKRSRKKGSCKGGEPSRNHIKQKKKVGKIHRHIKNQRLDRLYKQSTEIANRFDVVCVERNH